MDAKRIARPLMVAAALGAVAIAAPSRWPKDQTVHYVLGDAAGRVEEVDARWGDAAHAADDDDWARAATFRYAPGQAPRVVTHEPRLPDGDYTVQIEILASNERNMVTRHVRLAGGVTSIELAPSVPR